MELNQSIENPLGAGTQVGQAESFGHNAKQRCGFLLHRGSQFG